MEIQINKIEKRHFQPTNLIQHKTQAGRDFSRPEQAI